jgi:endonuclease YncB( thermonuclease family)
MNKIIILILSFVGIFLGYFLFKSPSLPRVTRVIDGDTIELETKQIIRLVNLYAPELKHCGGPEAKAALEEIALNRPVRVDGSYNDDHGRLLSLVYDGDVSINEKIVRTGWAWFKSQATPESEKIKIISADNKVNKIGVFSDLCNAPTPPSPQCTIKANYNEGSSIYSYPGCGSYKNTKIELFKGDRWFCTEAEAIKAGFIKAKNCQ